MTFKSTRTVLSLAALALVFVAGILAAGPLNPPAGPVASTYKTLTEVEPRIAISAANTPGDANSSFKITQPGSYYLTGNITGVAGKHGIEIAASGVTLDLNGFELRGVAGSLDGVDVNIGDGVNIIVKNGSLRSWGNCGLECEFIAGHPPSCVLENLMAASNAGAGFALWSSNRVVNCSAAENGADGFDIVGDSLVLDCSSNHNGDDGFSTNDGCTLTNCVATANTTRGFYGFAGCNFTNCSAISNATGFSSTASTFTGCAAYTNSANGFDLFTGCTVTSCNAYRNGALGINASSAATVKGCSVAENTSIGINASSGTTVLDCDVANNDGIGIQASSNCNIRDNNVANNGGTTFANIRITSSDTRVEGNNCTDAPIGIEVLVAGNIIISNTCSGNTTNWVIAASNYYGPIIDRTGVVTAAVNGAAAAGTLATTDPHANFSY